MYASTTDAYHSRSQWQGDTDMLSNISKESGKLSADGYVNVAQQLGLSGKRGMSLSFSSTMFELIGL